MLWALIAILALVWLPALVIAATAGADATRRTITNVLTGCDDLD